MALHSGYLFVGTIFLVVVVGGIVLLALFAMRGRPLSPGLPPAIGETPRQILDRRFAAGEITAEEYQKARDLLGPA
ncbi:MAG TPA: SHOCT domain-containing protein [Candidatus Micrarchaeaceae archaeon]|nr:SHOCT domain-containing protein [Candidatus Micrarchaeaceae archaeon]